MRLLSWNINGIRTLPMYHPWNTFKTGESMLNELGADIICFQEMKSTRQALEKHIASPGSYDAFFSFPISKGGYSGVGVFTKSSSVVPIKAEEGLSGHLQSGLKPPLSQDERITHAYPSAYEMDLVEDEAGNTHNDLSELDKEGRALILDFGLFVLINLYCPNETSDARLPYKMNFHLLLAERVRRLVEIDKREVIVTGDINICAAPIDHCDGELASNKEEFWTHPARKWFHEWLEPMGPMVDVVRRRWPERKGMFTCWNQKISARVSNYGTRVDYFLLTKGLLPWFKNGDILPSTKGSDHCPVYIDLHDEIVTESGEKIFLKDLMKLNREKRDPPRLASRYWDEYSGKQKLLSNFFVKKDSRAASNSATVAQSPAPTIAPILPVSSLVGSSEETAKSVISATEESDTKPLAKTAKGTDCVSISLSQELSDRSPLPSSSLSNLTASSSSGPAGVDMLSRQSPQPAAPGSAKRKKMQADSNYPAQQVNKKVKKNAPNTRSKQKPAGQTKLSSFFSTPSSSQGRIASQPEDDSTPSASLSDRSDCIIDVDQLIDDSDDIAPSSQLSLSSQGGKGKNAHSWSTLFARVEPPKCIVHGEPAREFKVNKPGPNKGKAFFVCSRPVGPGYDAGRDKRLREEVNPQYRCDFFKWRSEVKKAELREAEKKNGGCVS